MITSNSRFFRVAIGSGIAMTSVAWSSLAWAQAAPQGASTAPVSTADIVVTAQRRTERLQDVPISISVLSPELTSTQGISTTLDIQRAVPGLIFVQRNLNGLPFIRGIGAENTAGGDEPGVALYVDGVYRGSSAASTFSLPNIDQIEVLKGPQGTLFGRNATGGVINITTKAPSSEFGARASLGYANYDTLTGTAYITGPIASNLSFNVAGRYQKRSDGWGKNVATGNDVFTTSSRAIAGKLRLDLGDTIATLGADWSKDRWTGGPGQPLTPIPGRGSSIDGIPRYAGLYNVNSEIDSVLRAKNYGVDLNIEHDFGPLIVRSISAYRGTKSYLLADADATPVFGFNFTSALKERTFSQELQMLAAPDSAIQWIVGAFYLNTKSDLGPQRSIFPGASVAGFQSLSTTSLALFAQATFPLGERTNLTVGGRYTIDEKKYNLITNGGVFKDFPDRTYKSPTWRLALDHKFSDDLMVYGSYNRGFKSGAYGAGAEAPAVSPAVVDAFEAGFKSQVLDRRLTFNLAAFYSKYKNMQISTTVISGTTSFLQLLNAAAARAKGIDAELTFRPVPDLRLSASASILDAKYTTWLNAPLFQYAPNGFGLIRTVFDASGRTMSNAPKLSATLSASYIVHSGFGDIEFSASDSYVSKYYNTVDQLQASQARHLIGASVQLTSQDKRWSLQLWGNNLTNKKYFDVIAPNAYQNRVNPGAPRTYGVTATANF